MSEALPLHDRITETILDYLGDNGGGIADGFVYSLRYMNSEGKVMNELGCMDGQSTMLSAGLSKYMQTVVDAWVQDELFGEDED